MKKILQLQLLFLFILPMAGFAQLTLTYDHNMLVSGDSTSFKGFEYQNPGEAGAGLTWDFSKLVLNNSDIVSHLPYIPQQKLNGPATFNLLLDDAGYEYYMQSSPDMLVEVACAKENMSFIYTDPLIKMKFPFSYGEQFSDAFSGRAFFTDKPDFLITGNYTVIADGFGQLILPGVKLHNVLRVKQIKTLTEVRPCSVCRTKTENYRWYAEGQRYPVLSMSSVTYQIDNNEPVLTKKAFFNASQLVPQASASNPSAGISNNDNDLNTLPVSVYPNPFNDKLNYIYFLKSSANVSVQVTDVYGKSIRFIMDSQVQDKGMHSGEFDLSAYNLKPGVYFLRFVFDEKVITRKVVKI
ncbi:MAG: T9SS type A sorting domain-containing protein [Bacteroidota bacterium]